MGSNKAKRKTSPRKSSEQLAKDVLAVTQANIARIEAEERGARGEKVAADEAVPFKPARGKASSKPSGKNAPKAKAAKASGGKMSGLDAAAKVLADSGKPMKAKTIVEAMISKGLWTTGGKTPQATIYAAMIREIGEKGKDARFKKVGRGEFVATK